MSKELERLGLRFIHATEPKVFARWEKMERVYPWTQTHFEQTLHGDVSRTYVYEKDQTVVGYAVIQLVGEEAYLPNIMIVSSHRRRGEGSKLLQKIMIWSKENGAKQMLLDVDPANAAAVGLYKKLGFEIMERRVKSYPGGEDALVMRKKL